VCLPLRVSETMTELAFSTLPPEDLALCSQVEKTTRHPAATLNWWLGSQHSYSAVLETLDGFYQSFAVLKKRQLSIAIQDQGLNLIRGELQTPWLIATFNIIMT